MEIELQMRIYLKHYLTITCIAFALACKRTESQNVTGQSNTKITFFAKAVDQSGLPIAGVSFKFRVESIRKDWTYETRDKPNDVNILTPVSNEAGDIKFEIVAFKIILLEADRKGYRHLYDKDISSGSVNNRYFPLIEWGYLGYKSDVDNPTVYVFVKDGVREVSALPNRGGYEVAYSGKLSKNEPKRPKESSIPDVILLRPSTSSATRP